MFHLCSVLQYLVEAAFDPSTHFNPLNRGFIYVRSSVYSGSEPGILVVLRC